MPILTRRPGEAIRIGDEIEIFVVAVNGNQVRLGINAPKSVAVQREEIYARIAARAEGELPQPQTLGVQQNSD